MNGKTKNGENLHVDGRGLSISEYMILHCAILLFSSSLSFNAQSLLVVFIEKAVQ